MIRIDPYKLADSATPFLKIWFGYDTIGTENLKKASEKSFVVVATTHTSFLGAILAGLATRNTLNDKPYVVLHQRLRKDIFANFFTRGLHCSYVDENNGLNNRYALRDIEKVILNKETKSLIIAPQGDVNLPIPEKVNFKEGFAIPIIRAVNAGASVQIVPAIDYGIPYANHWSKAISQLIFPGKVKATVIFGEPIEVKPKIERAELTKIVENSVKDLMRKYI